MHPSEMVHAALALRAEGLDATEIGRRLGVAKSTVQYWCRGGRRELARREERRCVRCHELPLDEVRYAYLLGQYLGDGHINIRRGSVAALGVSCADDWPGVRAEVQEAMRVVMPSSLVHLVTRTGCHVVTSYCNHWPCLFPQHGPGRKHERPIVLEPWQQLIVEQYPGMLLRGLFHSDGCRVTNWTLTKTSSGMVRYEYPRYFFSNKSLDILGICTAALDRLEVAHRYSRWDTISVARRGAVARLDEFVGPKY